MEKIFGNVRGINIRFSIQAQIIGGLFLALISGLLLQESELFPLFVSQDEIMEPTQFHLTPTTPEKTTPMLYETLDSVWYVHVLIHSKDGPKIIEVKRLAKGRITSFSDGDSEVLVLDIYGNIIFRTSFQPDYKISGTEFVLDEVEMIFVLPSFLEEAQIKIVTPQGEDYYDIE